MKLSAVRKDGMWGGNVLAGNILRGGKENEGKERGADMVGERD